ncbi:MAG: phosphotransferase [Reichenbachiella sp.]
MEESIAHHIIQSTHAKRIIRQETIQSLWSGYGEIFRCWLEGGQFDSVVVKHVVLPDQVNHPRGWNTDLGHQRKVKSYEVESYWYKGLGRQCDNDCRIPRLIFHLEQGTKTLMVFEDLNSSGFPIKKSNATIAEIKACLLWLANFHAKYLGVKPEKLWNVGTYWHLATRPEELQRMGDKALKEASGGIDNYLNKAQFHTIVHGDAKLANFCFSQDEKSVAAVDFQYVGGGCGMKDVAYLLSSTLDDHTFDRFEKELLAYYFEELDKALIKGNYNTEIQDVIKEWKELYLFAWVDFYRFLDGWSPGHWKINNHIIDKKKKVLDLLKLKNEK